MTDAEKLTAVRGILSAAATDAEKAAQIKALFPSGLDEFLSKDEKLPLIWERFIALVSETVPVLMRPKILGYIAKQALTGKD